MIEGGTPTIYVSDMDRAVTFYTEVLGLRLISRHGDDWASVDAGKGLTLGLHPAAERMGAPGTLAGCGKSRVMDDSIASRKFLS